MIELPNCGIDRHPGRFSGLHCQMGRHILARRQDALKLANQYALTGQGMCCEVYVGAAIVYFLLGVFSQIGFVANDTLAWSDLRQVKPPANDQLSI